MSLAMSITERENFLADVHVGVISIPRPGRGPLTVPIWYDYTPSGPVTVITSANSIKGKLLAGADRISLCAQTESLPYRYVSVEGPFETRRPYEGELLRMASRYLGEAAGRDYAASAGDTDDSIVVCLSPHTWQSVDYGKR
ncbi:MAG: pyridoxamine 5'-phosphate oxidase [Pseudomonadota bacterium]